jgi:ABC-type oligopeptide transport system substrate-binding subunit
MPRRLAEARALYRAAGYGPARPLKCRLVLPADDTLRRVAIAIASMWHEALGVEASVVDMEYRAFLATRNDAASWDVRSHGWNADYPDPGNFLGVFVGASAQNDAHLRDAEFDRRMTDAGHDPDGARRLLALAAAERRLLETQAIIPLYYPVARRLVQPRVAGAILGPMDHNYSKYLSLRAP